MTEWPKKMWMSFAGSVNAYRDQIFDTDYPVLVYPADQAPEPVAWAVRDRLTGRIWWFDGSENEVRRTAEQYRDEVAPLYLAPPSESAIRASERERCAKLLESIAPAGTDSVLLVAAKEIRELGDE